MKKDSLKNSKKEIIQKVIVSHLFSNEKLENILMLEKCLPVEWQYGEEARSYYAEKLTEKGNINIFLKEGGLIVGYLLAVPMNDSFIIEITELDSEIKKDIERMYMDTIQILPESRGQGGAKKMMLALCEEAKKRNIKKFAVHARKVNDFSEKIKKIFGERITLVRQIEEWQPANGEPYEYIEWDLI